MTPLAGWLTSRFGRRRLCNACVLGFGVASLGCGLADSLAELVVFRALQGAIGAPLVPLSQAIVLDTYPKHRHGVATNVSQPVPRHTEINEHLANRILKLLRNS